MYGYVQPAVMVVVVVTIFGSLGGIVASNKGRSVALWSVLCGILPPLLILLLCLRRLDEGKSPRQAH